jgi:23S rRNA pseudouridine2457 synthase
MGTMNAPARRRHGEYHYLLFYKPYGVLSDMADPEGRPAAGAYVPGPGLEAAGRLDRDSEGLLLLTDDGFLSHRLTHPRYKQPKTYLVQVEGIPGPAALEALAGGVHVQGYLTEPAQVELLPAEPHLPSRPVPVRDQPGVPTAWLRFVLHEGHKRQIRHMTAAVGHPTLRLVRIAIGPLELGGLRPGQWRDLSPSELTALRHALTI